MKIVDYQKAVKRTVNKDLDTSDQILNFCLGLSGETGEVIDLIKKEFFQGHGRNNDKLKDEIGDVLWYLSNLCNELGYNIETILDMNIEKLNKRYPDGFKEEDSTNRDESTKVMLKLIDNYVGERDIIENKTANEKLEEILENAKNMTKEEYNKLFEETKEDSENGKLIESIIQLLNKIEIDWIGGYAGLERRIDNFVKQFEVDKSNLIKEIHKKINEGNSIKTALEDISDSLVNKSFTISEKHYPGKDLEKLKLVLEDIKKEDWKDVNDVY